jgi:hypothetical protein
MKASDGMSTPQIAVQARKRHYKKNLVAVGLILLALGAYTVYDSKSYSSYNSTFNLLPLKFFKITDNLKDTATITGTIQETGGRRVSFLIMSSMQFAQFQVGQGNTSLYSLLNIASGSISFSFPSPDTYYLMFLHGTGYLNTTETVAFQRSYIALGRFELFSGSLLIGLAGFLLYWGLRPKEPAPPRGFPKPSETIVGQP